MRSVCFLTFALFVAIAAYGQGNPYIAKSGDTAGQIARTHNISLSDFYLWNGLSPDNNTIYPGKPYIVEAPIETHESQEQEEPSIEGKAGEPIESPAPKPDPDPSQTGDTIPPGTGDDFNLGEENTSSSVSWFWLLLSVMVGAIFGIFLFYVLYVKKQIQEQEHKNSELSQKYHNLKREKSSDNSEMYGLRSKIQTLEREKQKLLNENINLGEEIDRLKAIQSNTNKNRTTDAHHVPASQVPNQPAEPPTTLYADAIIDDYFVKVRETPNEDSIFVLQLNGKNSADFDIYANAYSKVVANPSYLEGCEKQILYETKQIEVLSKGYTQQVDVDGKWKVIKKLNVIIK